MESTLVNSFTVLPLYVAGIFFFVTWQKKQGLNTMPEKLRKVSVETNDHSTPVKSKKPSSNDDLTFLSPISNSVNIVGPLVSKLSENSAHGDIIVIGIAGGSGSGKTTLARAIYDSLGATNITYIQHDSYYRDITHLTIAQREKQNFDHPDSLDTALLVEHIKSLKKKEDVCIPIYDFSTHARLNTKEALPARPIVLIEGILIFSDPALYNLIDVKVYVDTDDDVRLIRRIQRDTVERGRTLKSVINQYIQTVRPMHMQFVVPSKRNADIIVPEGLNSVALDLVVSRLKSHL
jgi:uridine kinase